MRRYLIYPLRIRVRSPAGRPDSGIAPGTPFEALPPDWVCPVCFVGKEDFEPVQDDE